jgi:hypothetical protein
MKRQRAAIIEREGVGYVSLCQDSESEHQKRWTAHRYALSHHPPVWCAQARVRSLTERPRAIRQEARSRPFCDDGHEAFRGLAAPPCWTGRLHRWLLRRRLPRGVVRIGKIRNWPILISPRRTTPLGAHDRRRFAGIGEPARAFGNGDRPPRGGAQRVGGKGQTGPNSLGTPIAEHGGAA